MNFDKASEAVMGDASCLQPLIECGTPDPKILCSFIEGVPADWHREVIAPVWLCCRLLHILKGQRRARQACVLSRRITSIRTSRYRSI